MKHSRVFVSAPAILALFAATAAAQTSAVVKLIDGRAETVLIREARFEDRANAQLRGVAGDGSVEFKAEEIWQIDCETETVPRGSAEQIWLRDGTRLSARLERLSQSREATVQSDLFRLLIVPGRLVAGFSSVSPPPPTLPPGASDHDVLYTTGGDQMVGRLLRLDEGGFVFRSELGSMDVARHRVGALVFAPSQEPEEPLERQWVLEFVNGDRVWTQQWKIENDGNIECALHRTQVKTPASLLRRAIHVGQGITVFSRIQPERFSIDPILAGVRGVLVDTGPENQPLRIGEREYLFGLFLRPQCELEYALDGKAEFFLAQLGVSSQLARQGKARVAMAVGDGPWKTFDLRDGNPPEAVAMRLAGARRLRLRVEAVEPWGGGEHVVLGEPVLAGKINK